MATKYKNGTDAKAGDKVVGVDHCNRPCAGVVVAGFAAHGQPELVFKNDAHGAVQSSLSLSNFLRSDESDWKPSDKPATAATPPLSTAK